MTLVVDASVLVRLVFELPGSDKADALLQEDEPWIAPDLIIAEVTNAAWKLVRFNRLEPKVAMQAVGKARKLIQRIIPSEVVGEAALSIACQLQHPAYDCFYLALAERYQASVATFDERLWRACGQSPFAGRIRLVR